MNVFVSLSEDQITVVGLFNMPQQAPLPVGYFGALPTSDSRVVAFCAANGLVLPETQPGA